MFNEILLFYIFYIDSLIYFTKIYNTHIPGNSKWAFKTWKCRFSVLIDSQNYKEFEKHAPGLLIFVSFPLPTLPFIWNELCCRPRAEQLNEPDQPTPAFPGLLRVLR